MKTPAPEGFASPVTKGSLKQTPGNWLCETSGAKFPIVDDIPWLTPDPQRALADWQNRTEALLAHLSENIANLKEQADRPGLGSLTRQRLKKVRALEIRHIEYLKDLLSPLKLKGKLNAAQAVAFGYRLPANQGLLGYFQNLIRDWSLKTGENEASFALLTECMDGSGPLGRTAVLGAGGCRLAYDLHQSGHPTETVCIDINPVLFLTARRILDGNTVTLVEFPIAAKNLDATGTLRECRVPAPPRPGLSLVFADCYHLPFQDGSLDTVVTPWLIDILPQPLPHLVAEINRVLKPGGAWLNTGSLNFQLRDMTACFSFEESKEVISENGFQIEALTQKPIPYLLSDLSCHHRTETVTTFRARKTTATLQSVATPDPRPNWLRDTHLPIGGSQILKASHVVFDVQAYVLSLVDGRRSIDDIAAMVTSRYGLPPANAKEAVISFFTRNYEDSIFQR